MPRTVFFDNKGMTLIEVMISLFLFLVISLALLQTSILSIDQNLTNRLRDEAVSVAEMRMKEARELTYTPTTDNLLSDNGSNLSRGTSPPTFSAAYITACAPSNAVKVQRVIGDTTFDFCTNRSTWAADPNTGVKQVTITVGWLWKGYPFTHVVSTIVGLQ